MSEAYLNADRREAFHCPAGAISLFTCRRQISPKSSPPVRPDPAVFDDQYRRPDLFRQVEVPLDVPLPTPRGERRETGEHKPFPVRLRLPGHRRVNRERRRPPGAPSGRFRRRIPQSASPPAAARTGRRPSRPSPSASRPPDRPSRPPAPASPPLDHQPDRRLLHLREGEGGRVLKKTGSRPRQTPG